MGETEKLIAAIDRLTEAVNRLANKPEYVSHYHYPAQTLPPYQNPWVTIGPSWGQMSGGGGTQQ